MQNMMGKKMKVDSSSSRLAKVTHSDDLLKLMDEFLICKSPICICIPYVLALPLSFCIIHLHL